MRRYVSVILLFSLTGCYGYVPVSGNASPESGAEVKAVLAPGHDFEVGEITVRNVTSVEGILFDSTDDSVAVRSYWLHTTASRFSSDGTLYTLDRSQVPELQVRKVRPAQTVIALGLVVAATFGVFTFIADPGGEPGTGEPGGPVEFRRGLRLAIP